MMSEVCSINVKESVGIRRDHEPIKVGIPFPKGIIKQLEYIALLESDLPQQFNVEQTAVWPDGSIKWGLFDFFCSLDSFESRQYKLLYSETPVTHSSKSLLIENIEQGYSINTGLAEFHIIKNSTEFFKVNSIKNFVLTNKINARLVLLDEDGKFVPTQINEIKRIDANNKIANRFLIDGYFNRNGRQDFIDFKIHMTFYMDSTTTKFDLIIHNKNAAKHPGGTWDLGDPGSVYFSEIRVDLNFNAINEIKYRLEQDKEWNSLKKEIDFSIYQESSGGTNWHGNNHKNRHGFVPFKLKGYQAMNQGSKINSGARATPYIHIIDGGLGCTCTINKFWQNFPKSIDINKETLSIKIFPGNFPDVFELQGGEKKTHTFYLNFSDDHTCLNWVESPLNPQLSIETYVSSGVFPYLTKESTNSKLWELIQAGIKGENNFFEKREIIDEYGWRNYGDIYADHEALGHKGVQPLVSHYNNQYDPIMGFALQYMVSGNPTWFELMDDLAKHVTDIDIYHTKEDRDEYNDGLFWHTDHYLDASTCTHRTFSREHNPESYLDYQKGGGPGTEHCYTTGLMYHYFMTGSDASQQAVLELCHWMMKLHRGSYTFLDRFHKFLTRDIQLITQLLAGENIPAYRYPLTRGTGNYINTLLDAYQLTNICSYLAMVERVIKDTIHPNDNIDKRNLGDIENTWSYTVFLQALCRYLRIKEELNQLDENFLYAKDSLLTYAHWMLDHEYTYLDKPSILEYPNHTWVAQEVRKANILYAANYYSPDNNNHFKYRADYFYSYTVRELESHESSSYTRLLVLLMQNYGPHNYYLTKLPIKYPSKSSSTIYGKPPHHSFTGVLRSAVIDLLKRLSVISPKNELLWLSFRSNYFFLLYNRLYITK